MAIFGFFVLDVRPLTPALSRHERGSWACSVWAVPAATRVPGDEEAVCCAGEHSWHYRGDPLRRLGGPLMDGSRLLGGYTRNSFGRGPVDTFEIVLDVPGKTAEIIAFYTKALTDAGWTAAPSLISQFDAFGSGGFVSFYEDEQRAQLRD